jgi:regulator of protease activity HflC (stomatin/prohibitin superfamily)
VSGTHADEGPLFQSVAIAFRVLQVFVIVLALGWLTAGVRPIPPGTQAVVQRFGRIVQVQQSGLLWSWPRPLESLVRLPSPERQMVLHVAARTASVPGIVDDSVQMRDIPPDAGLYLTGDGALVLLDASITWRIADAGAYLLAQDHVPAALRRLFIDAAVRVAAARQLDDFMAARPERAADPAAQAARNAVRGDLVAAMNAHLHMLADAGAGLGVEVTRADVTALLPPSAKTSYDAVLDATQRAEQGMAAARTDATRLRQQAERGRDSLLTAAHAQAEERLARARTSTASITALEARDPATRPSLLDQLYRDRISTILAQAASTSAVDPKSVSRVILPGAQ